MTTSNDTPTKRCSKCRQMFPATIDFFYHQRRGLYGFQSICKSCNYMYYKSTEEYRAKSREYARMRHSDPVHHAKELVEKTKRRRAKGVKPRPSPEQVKANRLARNRMKDKRPNRKLKHRINESTRRARAKGLPSDFTLADWQRALTYFDNRCAVCGRMPGFWHILAQDHWIPLSSSHCPGTVIWNIVPLCHSLKDGDESCNSTKSDRIPEQWLIDLYGVHKANRIIKRIETYFEWVKTCA